MRSASPNRRSSRAAVRSASKASTKPPTTSRGGSRAPVRASSPSRTIMRRSGGPAPVAGVGLGGVARPRDQGVVQFQDGPDRGLDVAGRHRRVEFGFEPADLGVQGGRRGLGRGGRRGRKRHPGPLFFQRPGRPARRWEGSRRWPTTSDTPCSADGDHPVADDGGGPGVEVEHAAGVLVDAEHPAGVGQLRLQHRPAAVRPGSRSGCRGCRPRRCRSAG